MNLAFMLNNQGKTVEAKALLEVVIAGYTEKLGADHTRTLMAKGNYGESLRQQGKTEQAWELLTKAHDRCLAQMGADHPNTKFFARTLSQCGA